MFAIEEVCWVFGEVRYRFVEALLCCLSRFEAG